MLPRARSRSPRLIEHWVTFGVRTDFVITSKPTALELRMGEDGGIVPWPPEWDVLFEGPDLPRVPGPRLCYKLFEQHGIFVDFLRTQRYKLFEQHGIFPAEFQIRKLDPAGLQWGIVLVFLGCGAKGKGKGSGAAHRQVWASGGTESPPRPCVPFG